MTGAGQLLCEDEGLGYTGQFFEGNFHGCGSLGTPAFQYQGQFKHGVFHGYGEEANYVSRYRGEFRNGKRHGKESVFGRRMGLAVLATIRMVGE